ncbi:M81 family metallopeptidase [Paenibacillus sp. IB182496]|uniref:M81 family metallopeptidase n=1 Tax=Paenibacillus sabuli TaxID=2772509 RepID=A0A927BYL8_9BACL|nr:M81 family metallopeptidase [Paenibacillus sabuli]
MRIAVAGIVHETNSFAPGTTRLEDFRGEWVSGEEDFAERYRDTRTSMGGVLDAAQTQACRLLPGLYTSTTPSAMVEAEAAERLLEALVDSVDERAQGLVLIMHGAMVSSQYMDPEGEALRRLRARFGADFPIVMTLDLHANISSEMAGLADAIVGYDTYPHVDMYERAVEATELLVRTLRGEIAPQSAYAHARMLVVPQAMLTAEGAMCDLMQQAFEAEHRPGVLNVTVAGGFPYSDVAFAGMSFVVTTDGDRALAQRCAAELAAYAWERRAAFTIDCVPPQQAIAEALSHAEGTVVLCEGADNVGGGAPGDATHVLACLTEVPAPALSVICDPAAAAAAFAAGVGGRFDGAVGGRSDRLHGDPVRLTGTVRLLSDGAYTHVGPYMTGQRAHMGRTAIVQCGRLTVVLTSLRTAPWDLGHVRSLGLWPADFRIIVAKSAIAWRTAFGAFAAASIQVDSPGCCTANLNHFSYRRLVRPIDPLDAEFVPTASSNSLISHTNGDFEEGL